MDRAPDLDLASGLEGNRGRNARRLSAKIEFISGAGRDDVVGDVVTELAVRGLIAGLIDPVGDQRNLAVVEGQAVAVALAIGAAWSAADHIEEQERREAALREQTELLGQEVDRAVVGMALTTLEGRFVRANPAFCRMLGSDPGIIGIHE